MSGKCQGKTKFSPGQGKSGNFEKMLGNFGHLTHVREFCNVMSWNFVVTLFLDSNFHHMISALPGWCLCKCLLGKM